MASQYPDFELIHRVASDLAAAFTQLEPMLTAAVENERRKRRIAPFVASGYSLAPSIPAELEEEIQQRPTHSARTLGAILLRHYSRANWSQLETAISNWETNGFFSPRMPLIRDALWAQRRGKYRLTVAGLLPQVEGIVWEWLYAFTTVEERKRFVSKEKEARKKARSDRQEKTVWVGNLIVHTIGSVQANALTRDQWARMYTFAHFANSMLFQRYILYKDYGRRLTSKRLSRHAFAHGGGLGSGTRANSLRLFLALDVLAMMQPPS